MADTTQIGMTYQSKAVRLCQQMLEDIERGEIEAGTSLPAAQELAERYRVSRPTVRRALGILTQKNKLIKLPQRGLLVPEGSRWADQGSRPHTVSRLTLAVLGAMDTNYSNTRRMEGMKRYADANNLRFLALISKRHEETLDTLTRIGNYSADGIIVYPYRDERYLAVLKNLMERHFPIVLTRSVEGLNLSTVMSNDETGGYQAANYLIEKYHRPVHYICEPVGEEVAVDRHRGYLNAMKDAGFENVIDEYTWTHGVSDVDSHYWSMEKNWRPGCEIAEKMFGKIKLPASIFCVNDIVARGVYLAAQKHGLVIGKDLVVVGTDDLPFARLLKPALTTIRPQTEELGYEDARLLHQLVQKIVQPPVHIRLPVELIVRESA